MSEQIQEAAQTAAENLWAQLRAAREARGLSLGQVSDQLKLTVRQLEAIERGDLSALPGSTFARGFVRNYARFLGLDADVFLRAGESSEAPAVAELPEQMITPSLGRMPSPGNPRYSALPIAALVLVLAVVLGAGWHYGWLEAREETALLKASQEEVSVPVVEASPAASEPLAESSVPAPQLEASAPASVVAAVVSVVQSAPQPVMPAAQSIPLATPSAVQSVPVRVTQSAPAAIAPAASGPAVGGLPRMTLSFEGDSWVEVRDASGQIVFSRLNQAGGLQEVQGQAPFDLVIGNAGKVKLSWKGRPVDLAPLIRGDVARVKLQ
ncbi:RodZ domain-containing protein [Uliginosibacterium aquaticum]|uniref:Helix-turn-helix domain-containing protein n=1 Tax=Uliginosibacterium aquaticum TaxID=2731212 RepID=A0ABX2ICD6_9RHOO|nr:RodZ domain-containing protein [Uliginosibacterium aquaticum]NSL54003.1 helix-turn-helix domain-containing protein [Uliginosibacterium aquaticum]